MADNFNVLFCTRHEGKVGSLYFSWGRIRLEHEYGPDIEEYTQVDRFTMAEEAIAAFEEWAYVGDGYEETPDYAGLNHAQRVEKLREFGAVNAAVGSPNRMVEICGGSYHPSRGKPCAPTVGVEEAADLYEKVTHCLAKYDNPIDRNASLVKHIRKHGMAEKLGY